MRIVHPALPCQVVRIRLFGAFAIHIGDQVVPEGAWRLRKAKSLVKLLALAPERRLHRERVMDLLWPDRATEAASNNLHQALYVARHALEAAGAEASTALPLRDDMLVLFPDAAVEVDVEAFEAAAALARASGELADYQAALALNSGELLLEDRYEQWAVGRREALSETHLGLLLETSGLLARAGDAAAAIETLEQVVVLDPLHEGAHRDLMRLFAAAGRRQRALGQYQQLREALRRDLAAEPDPQTARLYRALLRGDDDEPAPGRPAPRAPDARRTGPTPHNLPIALTSFVGRERELREVARLLDRNRLLTLTGAGGSGKTRLALEAAGSRLGTSPDGIWLVSSRRSETRISSPRPPPPRSSSPSPRSARHSTGSRAQLAPRRMLLILDNCEHLIAACALMAGRLLEACPDLRILATSREPLRVPGEVTWRVPSLALPGTGRRASVEELGRYESVRLFCERAADVAPGFALTDENAAAVAEICTRLDGMPLALELAAARTAALSPAQIAERLEDSLAVLTAGSRSAIDRQQTLRATLSWSHALLTDSERTLFRASRSFAGYFSLEAAEAVASVAAIDERDVADLLARLVDKSLVVAEDEGAGYRYRLLESMRQYARERLAASGEADAVEARHFDFYLGLARARRLRHGREWSLRPDRAARGRPRQPAAALAWALEHDADRALQLAVHMWPMWMAGSHFQEGRRWLDAVARGGAGAHLPPR